jgi:hypothetical protein
MPLQTPPEQYQVIDFESGPLKLPGQQIDTTYALNLVQQTFNVYETFRTQNHDRRWTGHDSLYSAWLPQKYWTGTPTPRASWSYPIVFDQIEAALPVLMQSIFSGQDYFQVQSENSSSQQEARDVHDHMDYILEHGKYDGGSTPRTEMKLAAKSQLLYGNGGVALEWDHKKNIPTISWVDIRDFYVDPGLTTPNIDESRSIIRKKLFTVAELEAMRDDPRITLPETSVLNWMAANRLTTFGDQTKRMQESFRGVSYTPGITDWVPAPSEKFIECLMYYSKDRIIWVLNRASVIYNDVNPYGFIPFSFAPCYIFPGRFYAMSIGDVQEANQRYLESLFNARLDELSLSIHPPRVTKRGSLMTPAQQRWSPGQVYQVDDPQKDIQMLMPTGATANVYSELQFIETAAEKRTGVNGIGQGVPRGGNINRTATGVQAQQTGTASRMQELVSNFEDYLLLPSLYKMFRMIGIHTVPGQQLPATDADGTQRTISADSFRYPMKFRMLAASRMITRDKLMQVYPFLTQALFQGPVMQALHQLGQTVDFNELTDMLQAATGTAKLYKLIRPLNDQEKQQRDQDAKQQQDQAEKDGQLRLQLGQMKAQTEQQTTQMRVQGELQKTQIQQQPKPPSQDDIVKAQAQQQILQQKAQYEQAAAQLNLQTEQQKMQAAAVKAEFEAQQKQQDLAFKRAESQHKLATQQQTSQLGLQQQAAAGSISPTDRS